METDFDDYSDDEFEEPEENPESEWVLDCGFEGCLMPGYHFRSECHNVEMMLVQEEEALQPHCTCRFGAGAAFHLEGCALRVKHAR